MKTATVRELRGEFPRLLRWLQAGETVRISRHGSIVAQLVPPTPDPTSDFKLPDFAEQRRRTLGRRSAKVRIPSAVDEERSTYDR
jgi:antitoxin (DNA-binding transcriptional repressor) of toxin-antitoxin stability system